LHIIGTAWCAQSQNGNWPCAQHRCRGACSTPFTHDHKYLTKQSRPDVEVLEALSGSVQIRILLLEQEEHLVRDVFVRTWGLGKSVKGNVVLKGPSPAFEISNKPAIALFLSQSFLSDRQKPETKKQRLFDEEHCEPEIDEEQLEHGQVYVQLLKDQYAAPLFSLHRRTFKMAPFWLSAGINCDMEVQEVASQIKVMLEVYMAGNFVNGDEGDKQPFTAPRYRQDGGY